MKRGPLFLAAALVEVLRFFVLMTLAAALGLLAQRPLIPSYLRYLAVGQLIFFAIFLFLWLDEGRYAVYRPLALAGKVVSLVALLPLFASFAGTLGGEGFIPAGRSALLAAAFLPLAELFGLLVLALYRRSPVLQDPEAPRLAQSSPEDIERVESLP